MRTDNQLTLAYVSSHPVDAARTLERLPQATTAGLLDHLDTADSAAVLGYMMPAMAAGVLAQCNAGRATDLFGRIPAAAAARILKSAETGNAKTLLDRLEHHQQVELRYLMRYPLDRVGSHMQAADAAMPDDLEPAEILRRLRHGNKGGEAEIWLVDRAHRLTGVVSITALLQAGAGVGLRSLMQSSPVALPGRMSLALARLQPAWHHWRRLPVIDDDGILIGLIDYQTLMATADPEAAKENLDPLDGVFELVRIYWITVSAMIDTLLQPQATTRRAGTTDDPRESNDAN